MVRLKNSTALHKDALLLPLRSGVTGVDIDGCPSSIRAAEALSGVYFVVVPSGLCVDLVVF